MSCFHKWNRQFLVNNFSKSWIDKDLKKHREIVLLDREKAMMPSTQPAVDRELFKRTCIKQLDLLKSQRKELIKQIRDIDSKCLDIERSLIGGNTSTNTVSTFTRKCPVGECKGFLSNDMKCGICDSLTCKRCNEIIIDSEHECNPGHVETMKLIRKDTKPCPSCGTMICKVSGCDQMWCPVCQGAFSWKTGQVEKGIIHNPHFYEYMNATGRQRRNEGDFECGGLPRPMPYIWSMDKYSIIRNIYRLLTHIQAVEMRRYRVLHNTEMNEFYRIRYMLNEITEVRFKQLIQREEKASLKKREIYDVYEMIHTTGSMYMREISGLIIKLNNDNTSYKRLDEILIELDELRTYTNDAFKMISMAFSNCITPSIPSNWYTIK
jgi:hypothetical protein